VLASFGGCLRSRAGRDIGPHERWPPPGAIVTRVAAARAPPRRTGPCSAWERARHVVPTCRASDRRGRRSRCDARRGRPSRIS
jgi:hypothetical protein